MIFYLIILFSIFFPFIYQFIFKKIRKIFYWILNKIFPISIKFNHSNNNSGKEDEVSNEKLNEEVKDDRIIIDNEKDQIEKMRDYLYECILDLNEGKGSDFSQYLWKHINKVIPQQWKHIDQECGLINRLPLWIEKLFSIYEHPFACKMIVSFLIFILLILTSNLWIHFILNNQYSKDNQNLSIDLNNNLPITNCINHFYLFESDLNNKLNNYSNQYCLFNSDRDGWKDSINLDYIKSKTISFNHKYKKGNEIIKKDSSLLVKFKKINESEFNNSLILYDMNTGDLYLQFFKILNMDKEDEKLIIINNKKHYQQQQQKLNINYKQEEVIKLIKYNDLINILNEIRNYDPNPCICPCYLGLIGNYSFLYNDVLSEWNILYQPYLYRNNTFSNLIESNINYNNNTNQYFIYEYIKQLVINYKEEDSILIHHESFIITSIPFQKEDIEEQIEIEKEKEKKSKGYIKTETTTNEIELLNMIHINKEEKMIKTTLEDSDAICYIHCENLNKKFIN